MAKYINKQGETIVKKLSDMTYEERTEYQYYYNQKQKNKYPNAFKRKKEKEGQTKIVYANRRQFYIIQAYIKREIQEPDVLKDLGLLEEFLAKQATKPEPFLIQLKDVVCEISRYIVNRLKDGTHSLRVIVYSRTKNDIKLGSNSLLVEQLVKL